MRKYLKSLITCPVHRWIARAFGALCGAAWIFLFVVDSKYFVLEFAEKVPMLPYVGCVLGLFALQAFLSPLLRCFDAWFIAVAVTGYATTVMSEYYNLYFWIVTVLTVCAVYFYLFRDDKLGLGDLKVPSWLCWVAVGTFAALFIGYVSAITVIRYTSYSASTFDLGIFAQMFHYMRTTGLPLTTCERDTLLSHFAVHFSPIYYVLLPGYMLFPSPAYLQIAQTVVLASGVIPLYLLVRQLGQSNRAAAIICIVYCMYPALMGGCSYDIHENCFLAPLLLWLFYCLEKNSALGIYISAVLTLFVKEDAAIFVACIGIYAFCYLKRRLHGAILFGVSVIYFVVVLALLSTIGDGNFLSWRYSNFIQNSDQSFLQIVKVILLNPAYMLMQAFNEGKLEFVAQMLIPLACLPLVNKQLGRLILLAPVLLLNLLTNYSYQYSTNFQYVFGAIAVLFYLAVCNLSRFKTAVRRTILPMMAVATLLVLVVTQSYTTMYLKIPKERWEQFDRINAAIALVPDDASVSTTGYFLPHMANRDELYDYRANVQTEYIVLDLRPDTEDINAATITKYHYLGYEDIAYEENLYIVMKFNDPAKK